MQISSQKLNKIKLGTGLGGRYRCMIFEMVLQHRGAVNTSKIFLMLKELNSPAMHLALKAESEAIAFETHVLKLPQVKGKQMNGEVVHQIGMLEIDLVAYVHNMTKKFNNMNDALTYHFDAILRALGGNLGKNPYRTDPLPKKQAASKTGAPAGVQELSAVGGMSNQCIFDAIKEAEMLPGVRVNVKNSHSREGGERKFIITSIDEPAKGTDPMAVLAYISDKRMDIVMKLQNLLDGYEIPKDEEPSVMRPSEITREHTPTIRVHRTCSVYVGVLECFGRSQDGNR